MPTTTKEQTVQELIQELQDFPSDAVICLTDAYGETFTIIGFEAGSDCVNVVISADDDDDEG
ncbi:MAG: hypothetical protein RMZ42_22480 [Nostoc sp. DedQUE05]|uniref:hypothetical protein n=1 Tax=Nostoc sp. DedQUE05 TaxID=3075391 RepID=UPI002AD3EB24|nr:hypothetical protein [Nostoc sp. DedQUE05]MDZ8094676.1 hypothetical protein [Nostoc sp. DedQUE05]